MLNLIKFFNNIKGLIGNRIYILLALVFAAGLIESVGVTLFLPIMQSGFGDDKLSKAIEFVFNLFHLKYSFTLTLGLIAVFFILRSVFLISSARYLGNISSNMLINLRRKILDGIFKSDYVYVLQKEIGYMNNAINRETSFVVEAFDTFANILSFSVYGAIYVGLSLLLNFRLTFMVVLISPFLVIMMRRLNSLSTRASMELSAAYGNFQSILIQALSKIKYLKSTNSSEKVSGVIDKENRQAGIQTFRLAFFYAITKYAFEPMFVLGVVGFLYYHVVVMKKNVNEVIFLAFLFFQIARQFINAQSSYRRFISSIGSIETLNKFQGELEENTEDLHQNGEAPDFNKEIVFKDVTVIFPNGKKALDGININIKPRAVVAFVGHSGSGKSTVANMITGIIKPTHGEISFGVASYDRIDFTNLRRNIGYVTQEDVVFSASIRDNIVLWDKMIDDRRLEKAIQMAHMDDFLKGLPNREGSMLGDNGLDISGGQRQRATIARELYKDTKLLILDEATSSLDSKSEKQIYENIKEFKGKKTLVVIAHRLSTIKNADYIYVLEDGRVVEEGTYGDLYEKKGQFQGMIEEQKLV